MAEIRKTASAPGTGAVIYDFPSGRARVIAAEPMERKDTAGITESARELARARDAVFAAPETRGLRIAELRSLIDRGAYQPDPKDIARRILDAGL
jgi:flagellar biosynthesis anti-sigma factor FlgM